MKRITYLLIIMLIVCVGLTACTSPESSPENEIPGQNNQESEQGREQEPLIGVHPLKKLS